MKHLLKPRVWLPTLSGVLIGLTLFIMLDEGKETMTQKYHNPVVPNTYVGYNYIQIGVNKLQRGFPRKGFFAYETQNKISW